uniref:Ig-like domain-containing protein n=1 Tax=Sinocyclocheilus rhinocerous TaxID=307959 RepID=A0A673KJW4_9TELE
VPGDPIAAHVGSTVIVPCWISPPENAEALEIRWYRHDQFSNPVLLYNHGKLQDVQEEPYRNRTSLALRSDQSGGLKDGDVSLRLEKLRVQDDGSFRCYVSGESAYDSREVVLKITVEITIDREHSHPDLKVSKDCKTVRDSEDYQHTGEGFPFQLCAFGAQRFTSGRHYWEVELAHSPNPPKNFWIIGVVKHGHFTARDRSALTPSNGFWFLCSDGPHGFYTNTEPSIRFSLTPRPERLGVLFDYDDGLLSFYNVKESTHLLTISSRFSESVVPLFNPGAGDPSPLRILDCPKPAELAVDIFPVNLIYNHSLGPELPIMLVSTRGKHLFQLILPNAASISLNGETSNSPKLFTKITNTFHI